MANDLKPFENVSRVFWIKIELKEKSRKGRQVFGEIREVISGDKSLIKDFFDIIDFIIPYARGIGIQINWSWQFANWINGKLIRKHRKVYKKY